MKKKVLRRIFNRILHMLARFLPGQRSVRPFLHRLRGVKIHGKVIIGDEVYLENEYPECIEIHDQASITVRCIIMHTRGPGKIIIGKKAFIGPNSVIIAAPGRTITIGEGSVIAAASVISRNIPPYTFWGGEKAKIIAKVSVPMTAETEYEDFVKGLIPLRKNKNFPHKPNSIVPKS